MKKKEDIKLSNGSQWVRFDIELTPEQSSRLDDLCKRCYRTRKNFAEALIILAVSSRESTLDLGKLGVIETSFNILTPKLKNAKSEL